MGWLGVTTLIVRTLTVLLGTLSNFTSASHQNSYLHPTLLMLDCNRLPFLQSQNVCSSAVPGSVARPNFFGCNTRRGSSGSSACATVMLDAACVVSRSASQDACELAKLESMEETYAYSASSALRSRSLPCVELRHSGPPLEGSQAIALSYSWVVNWNALIMQRASSQMPALLPLGLWTRLAQQARVQAVQRQHH